MCCVCVAGLTLGSAFVRQRSNFILGWQAAVDAGGRWPRGESAGSVGSGEVPALGSWMMLPDLTSPATQTVLPMNDAWYGAPTSSSTGRARTWCDSRPTPMVATTR